MNLDKKKQVVALGQANDIDAAKMLCAEICASDEQDAEAWYLLGAINGRLGLLEEAVECCGKAIALHPDLTEARFNLGLALLGQGKFKESAICFHEILKRQPGNTAAVDYFMRADRLASKDSVLMLNIADEALVCVPGSLQLMTPYVLLEQEDWFEDEIVFVRRLIQPGMQVIDIGANYGVYTLTIARHVGPTGSVWAFEPASSTASFLRQSLDHNQMANVHLLQAGLSSHRGTAQLVLQENSELNALSQAADDTAASETVSLLTLDDCAREHGWTGIQFVKLDAEGEESNIIQGGARFFARQSPLVMFELKHGDKPNIGLIEQFRALGYVTYHLIPGLNLLAPFNLADPLDAYQLNLFCCKDDRAAELEARRLLARSTTSSPAIPETNDNWWQNHVRTLPYARGFKAQWAEVMRGQALLGWDHYRNALEYYAMAHSESFSPAASFACLRAAFSEVNAALAVQPSTARFQSFARMAWELGNRSQAMQAIRQLFSLRNRGEPLDLKEPFLSVSRCFDRIDPGADIDKWCQGSFLEQLEKLQAHSSYFIGMASLQNLEAFRNLGWNVPAMERRRQLVRLRHGLQTRPETNPMSATKNAENLNPEFWNR